MSRKIFIDIPEKSVKGMDIVHLFSRRLKPTSGQIGIEIEVEGNKFKKEELGLKYWAYHHDGSLRGEDNAEYVLKKPIEFIKVPDALDELWKMFNDYGSKLDESNRTSVHVHLNVQKFYLNRLCSFMSLYFSLEEVLTQWCGEHRVGNLFCLRAKDAPGIISKLKYFFQNDGQGDGLSEGLHYGGLNAHALYKFGSVEIRALRGAKDPQLILDWAGVLERLYNLSAEFKDPREICENFSGGGAPAYFDMLLGDKAKLVREGTGMSNQELNEALHDGIRIAQDLCYCRDWSKYEPLEVRPDPFRRPANKVVQGLDAALDELDDIDYLAGPLPSAIPSEPGMIYDPYSHIYLAPTLHNQLLHQQQQQTLAQTYSHYLNTLPPTQAPAWTVAETASEDGPEEAVEPEDFEEDFDIPEEEANF